MTITFECSDCTQRLTAVEDHGGLELACPSCARQVVIPTTIQRANQIVDRISEVSRTGGFLRITSLSRVGASSRAEAIRALYIVTAETFQNAYRHKTPQNAKILEDFIRASSGSGMWLATSLLPDDELSAFARLPDIEDLLKRCRSTDVAEQRTAMQQFSEHHKEEERLRKVAMTDSAFTQTETIESFVSFLRGLNPRAQDYWPLVYRRIRLAYPSACSPARAAEVSKPKTSWLRKLFG